MGLRTVRPGLDRWVEREHGVCAFAVAFLSLTLAVYIEPQNERGSIFADKYHTESVKIILHALIAILLKAGTEGVIA